MAALGVVTGALDRHIARAEGDEPAADAADAQARLDALADAASALPAPSALDAIAATFRLSAFERDVLLLCAGAELDARVAALCAAAQGDARRAYPTWGLALAALPDAHWSALAPIAPLRRWRLIELGGGELLTASLLRIDERILHQLVGIPQLDERLRGIVERASAPIPLPASHEAAARRIERIWSAADPSVGAPHVQLCGDDPLARRAVAVTVCRTIGLDLHVMRAADVPLVLAEREAVAHLWNRESLLARPALLVECDEPEGAEISAAVVPFVERLGGPVFVGAREPLRLRQRLSVTCDVRRPTASEQRVLWDRALGPLGARLNGQVDAVTAQFRLGLSGIRAAGVEVATALVTEGGATERVLWNACRRQARPRLDGLAQRIEANATWDDLVIPERQRAVLAEIAAHVRHQLTVYERWGFGSRSARGLGVSALFHGPSGTGKTMAAEVLASELALDLYRIDLSQVVSKYIGETEKNLRRIFDAAEEGGAILLFDEADALFGKRSEVKDSHDRYANIEVSYLLQRMEAYRGLAVLTTNMKGALDSAFLRRLRFVVAFPFPDVADRAAIWGRIFPRETPTEALDPVRLARLNVAGGNIRNIALHAAFLAAAAGEPVRMTHVLQAARGEYAKVEKALTDAEISGWA
ncbi:MAG: ATP-binding protein [Candidatus Rokubacteria bacterium]|nr:ATP-binding protein [Candidatus Rokubacteria bacterium]